MRDLVGLLNTIPRVLYHPSLEKYVVQSGQKPETVADGKIRTLILKQHPYVIFWCLFFLTLLYLLLCMYVCRSERNTVPGWSRGVPQHSAKYQGNYRQFLPVCSCLCKALQRVQVWFHCSIVCLFICLFGDRSFVVFIVILVRKEGSTMWFNLFLSLTFVFFFCSSFQVSFPVWSWVVDRQVPNTTNTHAGAVQPRSREVYQVGLGYGPYPDLIYPRHLVHRFKGSEGQSDAHPIQSYWRMSIVVFCCCLVISFCFRFRFFFVVLNLWHSLTFLFHWLVFISILCSFGGRFVFVF